MLKSMGVRTATEELVAVQTFRLVSAATFSRAGLLQARGQIRPDVAVTDLLCSCLIRTLFRGHEQIVRDDIGVDEFQPDPQIFLLIGSFAGSVTINALVVIHSRKQGWVPFKQRRSRLADRAGAIAHNAVSGSVMSGNQSEVYR